MLTLFREAFCSTLTASFLSMSFKERSCLSVRPVALKWWLSVLMGTENFTGSRKQTSSEFAVVSFLLTLCL